MLGSFDVEICDFGFVAGTYDFWCFRWEDLWFWSIQMRRFVFLGVFDVVIFVTLGAIDEEMCDFGGFPCGNE